MKLNRKDYKNEMQEQGRSLPKKNKYLKASAVLLIGIAFFILLLNIFY